jgi:hypothetical protein
MAGFMWWPMPAGVYCGLTVHGARHPACPVNCLPTGSATAVAKLPLCEPNGGQTRTHRGDHVHAQIDRDPTLPWPSPGMLVRLLLTRASATCTAQL